MNPRHFFYFLLSFLGSFPAFAFSQSGSQPNYFLPQLMPRSPNATALEKYGTYQVNEFTGVPDISIPLYTIDAGGFKVPITLSYHASGIKINDVATWAGLGWSVSSGGQISRRTMGLPDDYTYGYLYGHMRQPETYSSTTSDGVHYLDSAATNLCDTRPDIYSYDFNGHNGKFFFDGSLGQNYTPRFVPLAPLKLTHGPGKALSNFTITDEHGDVYNFGGPGAVDTTTTETEGTNEQVSGSAWKISSMISQNRRDTVSFSYQFDSIDPPSSDTEIYTVTDNCVMDPLSKYSPSYTSSPRYMGNFVNNEEQLVRQINFRNGKVAFDVDTARHDIAHAYRLKDIKVYQYNYETKQMEVQKTIVFYHSPFDSGTKRLRLDSIQILDKAGSIIQHYRFDYNMTVALPAYLSYAEDYWGYYNGCDGPPHKTANTMLTPALRVQYNPGTPTWVTIGQANRAPDSNYMQAYILTGIHYPTGGYSTFTYQTNQYDTTGVLALAGGLRIHTISSYDGVNPTPIVKTYVYNTARPNFFLDYSFFQTMQIHRYYAMQGVSCDIQAYADVRSFSNMPHSDLEAWDGATVVYPSVTEYIGTPGTNVGRTDYAFTDMQDSYYDASIAGSLVYNSAFWYRGHLLSKKEFIHLPGGGYQPVRLTSNTYTAFPQRQYQQVGLAVRKLYYNEGPCGANPFEPGTAFPQDDQNSYSPTPLYYEIVSDDNYLTSTTTNVYDINDTTKYTTSTATYAYDDTTHQQLIKTTHVDSKGNTHITSNKYAYDYLSGSTTHNAVLDSMINRNMYAEVIEKWDSLKNVTTSLNGVTGGQLNQYKAGAQPGSIVPATISTLSAGSPLTNFTPSSVNSGTGVLSGDSRYIKMISFDLYDLENNITQYTPRNATPTSIFWSYLYENPVAQFKNTTNANLAYTSFEADANGNWTYAGKPITDLTAPTGYMVYPLSSGAVSAFTSTATPYVLSLWSNGAAPTVYTGSYLTGTAMTTINGWTYYEYQVPTGSSSVSISGSMSIDELRLYPASAQMTTYAYAPEGLTAIADAKGGIQHFEYDYFQRLKNIKDFYGNIVNNYGYHTYDQTIGNDAQSGVITRNNCPPNTAPGSLTYSVPANKYYSSTKASANAEAIYDMNTNGQAKANQYCGCPVIYISIMVTNSSGIAGFPITFYGLPAYNVPTGTSYISVPQGIYSTVQVGPSGSGTHNYSLGAYPPQNGVHYATFTSVQVGPTFTITIN